MRRTLASLPMFKDNVTTLQTWRAIFQGLALGNTFKDVHLEDPIDIEANEFLKFNETTRQWVNSELSEYDFTLVDYTPTLSASGAMTWTGTSISYAFYIDFGNLFFVGLRATGTTGGVASTDLVATLPFTPLYSNWPLWGVTIDGAAIAGYFQTSSATVVARRYDAANFSLAAGNGFSAVGIIPKA